MFSFGIVGYGNLGKGVSLATKYNKDAKCVGIFTRRNPKDIIPLINVPVYSVKTLPNFKGKIDVLVLCGGSATDLPNTTLKYLKDFNTIDSFDNHKNIPKYFNSLDKVAKKNGTLSLISVGWDPGIFSLSRVLFSSALVNGKGYTFWGKGVSQGHSEAIRKIEGVKNAIQYTIPNLDMVKKVKSGKNLTIIESEKHIRECFVVLKENANKVAIEREIVNMPNYFMGYKTIVNFISEEEFNKNHTSMAHGGLVIYNEKTTSENSHTLELSLKLDSNPQFTGGVVLCYARALCKLYKENKRGAITVLDVPVSYLSKLSNKTLRKKYL